jgi:hypothetical protein
MYIFIELICLYFTMRRIWLSFGQGLYQHQASPWSLVFSTLYVYIRAVYTLLNHKRNEEILEELHVTPLEDKLCTYRHKWFRHVHRMEGNRLQNNFWIIIQKEDDDLEDHVRDY